MRWIINRLKRNLCTNGQKLKPPWCVLFFGTDEFSVASLKALNEERLSCPTLISNLEVVTRPKTNPVRLFAQKNGLKTHDWPLPTHHHQFHIGLVVSFGHLIPGEVIDSFPMGMLNVHASLLPRWRGAAPIVYAIANGDRKTGVSVMRIKPDKFDIGEVLRREEVEIGNDETLPQLYTKLAVLGSTKLLEVVRDLPAVLQSGEAQGNIGVTYAPKIDISMGDVNFYKLSGREVYNLFRALTGLYPLASKWNGLNVKFHKVAGYDVNSNLKPGEAEYVKKSRQLLIGCKEGCILVDTIGVQKKKVMTAEEFNNGYVKKQPVGYRIFK